MAAYGGTVHSRSALGKNRHRQDMAEVCLRLAQPRYAELERGGIDGRAHPQGGGVKQANKGTLQDGFSLQHIDPLKQSAPMSVGDADNMPR